MRYSIINFTRLGDLLQTQSTIAALKKNGDHQVSLICLENFASAANFISELDDIAVFPSSTILREIQTDWRQALLTLDSWIDNYYKEFPFDIVLNLTPTMSCRVFAQLLSRRNEQINILGFGLDSFGFGKNSSVWTSYVQAVTQERGCSPYNLVDGFRSMLALPPEPFQLHIPESTSPETIQLFLQDAKQSICTQFPSLAMEKLSFVGFQLGASDEKRQWDTANFVELAQVLWKERNIIPVLFGSNSELPIAEKYIAQNQTLNNSTPFINLCGKTNLEELGVALCELEALVSNDTGTLHLAVGLGTPVLGIYLATAQAWDTGPYGEGHLCIEPRLDCHPCAFGFQCPYNYKCRQSVSAQSVYDTLSILLDKPKELHNTKTNDHTNNEVNPKNSQNNLANSNITPNASDTSILYNDVRVWQGYFDDAGFISYKSLSGDEKSDRTLWMACQRLFYKNLISAIGSMDVEDAFTQKYPETPMPYIKANAYIANNIEFIERLLSFILLAKEQASMLNIRPSTKLQEGFLSTIQRIESYFQQNPSFTPLLLLWKYLIQENGKSIENLIHFFDTLHSELSQFKAYLILSSK